MQPICNPSEFLLELLVALSFRHDERDEDDCSGVTGLVSERFPSRDVIDRRFREVSLSAIAPPPSEELNVMALVGRR